MAGLTQFQSFVGKFVSLWQQGLDARLNVNCSAGQAWVQLHVGLVDAHGPQQQEPQGHVRVPGPACLRRRQRRAEERRKEAEKAKEEVANNIIRASLGKRGKICSAVQTASLTSTHH